MPKRKFKGDKEKPLLTMQGVLRLDRSFVTAQHDDAQTIKIQRTENSEPELLKLVPGQSEHDLVQYKAGYDVGPANPLPQNDLEEKLFEEQSKVQSRQDAFEEMKTKSREERERREQEFIKKGFVIEPLSKIKAEESSAQDKPVVEWDPQNPSNYQLPALDEDHDNGAENETPRATPAVDSAADSAPREGEGETRTAGSPPFAPPPGEEETTGKHETTNPEEVTQETERDEATNTEELTKETEKHEATNTKEATEKMEKHEATNTEEVTEGMEKHEATNTEEVTEGMEKHEATNTEEATEKMEKHEATNTEEVTATDPDSVAEMALQVAKQMEAERKRKAREQLLEAEHNGDEICDETLYSLDELTQLQEARDGTAGAGGGVGGGGATAHGPQLPSATEQDALIKAQQDQLNNKQILDSYWQFVRENPQDFNGWCYLVQHVESVDELEEVRSVYNAFLPLFPYCYAYWQRYSEIEKRHENWQRALALLHRGLEAIPLCVDLWLAYLELYHAMYHEHADFVPLFRVQCERAVQTVGLDYRSDRLWERYVHWQLEAGRLHWVTGIFKRLVAVPTKLYNKHWDNFIAHVRDHHPRDILAYDEYEALRRLTCQELGLTYRPDPVSGPGSKPRDVVHPEDKLKAGMKERIVASVVEDHERCERQVEERAKFEDKIKRSYFHVKPVDLKQLKNWEAYLDFEIGQGNHERIIVLFERCLIPCAQYEQFWIRYAHYLEQYHREHPAAGRSDTPSAQRDARESILKKAKWSFGTGLAAVAEMREKRCTWTLKGWKDTDQDGNEVMRAEEERSADKTEAESEKTMAKAAEESSALSDKDAVDKEMSGLLKTTWDNQGRQAVRDVYHRACIVHCPKKATIKLRWAAFEEDSGDHDRARDILRKLRDLYPLLLECRLQLIDLERRQGNLDRAEDEYRALVKKIPRNRHQIRTWLLIKQARFQAKVQGEPDKALSTLRAALKKEKSDPMLYSQIIDVCYQRHPIDVAGVTAAIELALKSSELSNIQKLEFIKRKVEFMGEFGDVRRFRDACDQIKAFRRKCAAELKEIAKKKRELEEEEAKLKELENLKAKVRAEANMKAKIAEIEGRLLCTNCQTEMYPDVKGVYEFEGFNASASSALREAAQARAERKKQEDAEPDEEDPDGDVVDIMDLVMTDEQEEQIKKTLDAKTKYKEVAPTWELNMESYGYAKNKKAYDPDYEHVESARFREYERLEGEGYSADLKDPDHNKPRNISAPGLGSIDPATKKRIPPKADHAEDASQYSTNDYVIPPKVPQMALGLKNVPSKAAVEKACDEGMVSMVFELPAEIADVQKSPCVNVPEWFVKDGGELCLSETENGMSILRYWPKFLNEKGKVKFFNQLRKYCKWHQKQIKVDGEWKYETRLVAWYAPCDYDYSGLHLDKNRNWPVELMDMLPRLKSMTRQEYNSCFLSLYRHGHDMSGWHSDLHPQYGNHPTIASVSLGTVRVFEFRRKNGPPNFIRFPLFPGSLLVMEGATQVDWLHCLPRDVECKEERINLTFRTLYSLG